MVTLLLLILLNIVFGIAAIASKAALSTGISGLFFVALRLISGGILLLVAYLIFNKKRLSISKRDWLLFTQLGIAIFIDFALLTWPLAHLPAAKVMLFYQFTPFFTVFLSYMFFGERMTVRKWLALLVGFVALVPVIMTNFSAQEAALSSSLLSAHEIALLVCVFAYSYAFIIMKRLTGERGYNSMVVNGFGMSIPGVFALLLSIISDPPLSSVPYEKWRLFLPLTAVVTVLIAVLFYNVYGALLRRFSATFLSFSMFGIPIVTGILGWAVFGNKPPLVMFPALALVVGGLYLFYQEEKRQGYIQ